MTAPFFGTDRSPQSVPCVQCGGERSFSMWGVAGKKRWCVCRYACDEVDLDAEETYQLGREQCPVCEVTPGRSGCDCWVPTCTAAEVRAG